MNKGHRAVLALAVASMGSAGVARAQSVPVIPVPASVLSRSDSFRLGTDVVLRHDGRSRSEASLLAEELAVRLGRAPKVTGIASSNDSAPAIVLRVDASVGSKSGAYRLDIGAGGIEIVGNDAAGVFYGTQTLLQICPPKGDGLWKSVGGTALAGVRIEDAPTFGWRGLQVDTGRWYLPLADLKKIIDQMAFHKMNVFHWHLTEDQGWRFESRKYPKLTSVGAWRPSSPPYGNRNGSDNTRHGGFYTQKECRALVAYAAKRHITVVPEIEIPGHSSAAIAAYPALGNDDIAGYNPIVSPRWGVHPYTYSPKEETFRFLEDILSEVCEVFPSKFIHIGGDEAPKTQWKNSPFAQSVMKREGLKDEEELQSWFIRRIEGILAKKGRRIIGWDEIREGGLSPNATVMAWRSEQYGIDTAKEGKDVVMAPTSHLYLDYYQADPKSELAKGAEYECIGGFLPLEKVYSYYPIPTTLTAQETKHVLGLEGQVWGEYFKSLDKAMYLAFPRAAAVAEIGWSPRERKDWNGFVGRLKSVSGHWDAAGVKYGPFPGNPGK